MYQEGQPPMVAGGGHQSGIPAGGRAWGGWEGSGGTASENKVLPRS